MWGGAVFSGLAGLRYGERSETVVTSWGFLACVAVVFLLAGTLAVVIELHMRLIAVRRGRNRRKPVLFDQDTVEYVQVVA
jgi:hypothetical protein